MDKKPYKRAHLVVPKLIEQNTWGGDHIIKSKDWDKQKCFAGKTIGQSFELYKDSQLAIEAEQSDVPFLAQLSAGHDAGLTTPISKLASKHGESFLGSAIEKKYGKQVGILIKYTHARGNSFQLHARENEHRWQSKPESWFYLEKGLLTLGVKEGISWMEYKYCLIEIDREMQTLSEEMKQGRLSPEEGKAKGRAIVAKYDPWRFVNMIESQRDDIIDLSACALHHSWEEDGEKIPQGNIVYELQADVADEVSSIRGFDKGKIGTDGSLRPVHIDDYFRLIDRDTDYNKPERHMRNALCIRDDDTVQIKRALDTEWYSMEIAKISGRTKFAHDAKSYRHIFVRSGTLLIETSENQLQVGSGHSAFIPASVNEYALENRDEATEALITFIA